MPVVIDERYLPARLTAPPMTDDEFEAFCSEHPDCFIEMTAEGELIIMPPAYWLTAARGGEILYQLKSWARQRAEGLVVDASGGFRLPNGARRSPDAAWISRKQIAGMKVTGPGRTWLLCPEFVIELRSEADRLPTIRRKMREWTANGAHLGWLIDPERRAVEIYREGCEPRILTGVDAVAGEGLFEDFTLDLKPVWDPLA
jgi:Uma2 family endonuclease